MISVDRIELDGMPFVLEWHKGADVVMIFNTAGLLVGLLDTSTSKQALTTETLNKVVKDRAARLLRQLKQAGVKL